MINKSAAITKPRCRSTNEMVSSSLGLKLLRPNKAKTTAAALPTTFTIGSGKKKNESSRNKNELAAYSTSNDLADLASGEPLIPCCGPSILSLCLKFILKIFRDLVGVVSKFATAAVRIEALLAEKNPASLERRCRQL